MKCNVVFNKVSEGYIGFVKKLPGAPHLKPSSPHCSTILNPENPLIQ